MNKMLIKQFIENRRRPPSANSSAEIVEQIQRLSIVAPKFLIRALCETSTHITQKAEILVALVRQQFESQKLENKAIIQAVQSLNDREFLFVLDALRKRRIDGRRLNGRRVKLIGLKSIFGHHRLAELAASHRLRLVRLLRHFMGERTWSSVCRSLNESSTEAGKFLNEKALRFALDVETAWEVLCFLGGVGFIQSLDKRESWLTLPWLNKPKQVGMRYANSSLRQSVLARGNLAQGRGMPQQVLSGIRGTYHQDVTRRELRELVAPAPRRASEDGVVTAEIKRAMSSNEVQTLEAIVAKNASSTSPVIEVKAAVVLDLSASMVASGERLYHPASLGLALVGLLQRHVHSLEVFQVGGSMVLNGHGLPRPQGETDLASAVLQAARSNPDTILIVTDGFENFRQGDVRQVVSGLRQLGQDIQVEQVTPVIAVAEDLSSRRLCESIPVVPIEHENGVGELAARILLAGQSDMLDEDTMRDVEQLLFTS